ncbi:MAG: right-handed parallel beta-helix repeat-containing protein [Hyphomicrobiales bacterium]|nr:right-handed parallel beta-helix repeat-containing protein [Hyphomicrobiales bacterium]
MILARRGFLAAGGLVAGGGLIPAAKAQAGARAVSELGVKPDTGEDVSSALQQAIMELSEAGQAVFIPGGTYHLSQLALPENCSIFGVAGQTRLVLQAEASVFIARNCQTLLISGLMVEGGVLTGSARDVGIENLQVSKAGKSGIAVSEAENINISRCRFSNCADAAISVGTSANLASAASLTGNLIAGCGTGIALAGTGHVTGNSITSAAEFGLKLGGASGNGRIFADGNIISDCATGIGIAANNETLLVSLNLITGLQAGAKTAIRAFDGNELVGPDLAFESAEAYLNLTVVGNVAR